MEQMGFSNSFSSSIFPIEIIEKFCGYTDPSKISIFNTATYQHIYNQEIKKNKYNC